MHYLQNLHKFPCRHISIVPRNKLTAKYSRSSGPGGQSVNKSETKVQLRFHIDTADWLDDEVRRNLKITSKNKISSKGYLIVSSDIHSSRIYNYEQCIKLIQQAIDEAKDYKPKQQLAFLEQIQSSKSPQEVILLQFRY